MFRYLLFISYGLFWVSGGVAAQPPSTSAALKAAYAMSQNAKTEAEYTLVIDQIRQQDLASAAPEVRQYGEHLLAWALNRRGEVRWDSMQQPDDANATAAIEDFRESLKFDPSRWRAKQNMAFVYATRGQLKESLQLFDEVIETKPDHANAYFNRGELRYELQNWEAALADYDRAIALQPGEADFYTSRGHTRYQLGRIDSAIEDYQTAYRIDAGDPLRAIDLADGLQNAGQWGRAAETYRTAIRLDGGNLRAQLNLAWLLSTCPDGSIRNASQALQIIQNLKEIPEAEQFRYIDTYAAALAEAGQFQEAVRVAQTGTNIVPESERAGFEARRAMYEANQRFRQQPAKN
ncbi:MAG: tetratricopeptide repeat protein [Pirellulaceae bacterium]